MKNCPFCKKTITENVSTCPHCGCVLVEKISSKPAQQTSYTYYQNTNTSTVKQPKNYFKQIINKIRDLKWNSFNKYVPILALLILIIFISSHKGKTQINDSYQPPVSVIPNNDLNISANSAVQAKDPKTYISLSNGTILSSNPYYLNGLGQLKIDNGTNLDAIAKLVNLSTNKSILTVYIKANSIYSMSDISDGNYKLLFNLGNDWDTVVKAFSVNSSYEVFEENFDFVTTEYREGDYIRTRYATFSVTLNPVIGGQAETARVNATEFGSY